jgi:hypothetical protein
MPMCWSSDKRAARLPGSSFSVSSCASASLPLKCSLASPKFSPFAGGVGREASLGSCAGTLTSDEEGGRVVAAGWRGGIREELLLRYMRLVLGGRG